MRRHEVRRVGGGRPTAGQRASSGAYLDTTDAETINEALRSSQKGPSTWELYQRVMTSGDSARRLLPLEIEELSTQLSRVSGLKLWGALHMFDAVRRSSMDGPKNFGSDAMLDLLAGLLTSLPEDVASAHLSDELDVGVLFKVDRKLRDIANLQRQIDLATPPPESTSIKGEVLNSLRLENHFDRMAGFDVHLHRVADEVFARVDQLALQHFGFRWSDSLRFADLYNKRRWIHLDDAELAERARLDSMPSVPAHERGIANAWLAGMWALDTSPPLEGQSDEAIADSLGMSAEGFRRLVHSMSTDLGSQSVTTLGGLNTVRYRPIIRTTSGSWMWPRPIDFVHGVFDWALSVCEDEPAMRGQLDKARQAVAERFPAELLSQVFGSHAVPNVRYAVEESDAEVDVVVALPGATLIVECKGGRFSPAGRRAAPGRVATHARELVQRAADQNDRATKALHAGVPFRGPNDQPLELDREGVVIPLIVTFDRVDPFSSHMGYPTEGDVGNRSLILALSDLLLLVEVLPEPSNLFAYLQHRIEMVRKGNCYVWSESDALGAWCEDRLTRLTTMPVPDGYSPTPVKAVSRTSAWMNEYYTYAAMRRLGAPEDMLANWAEARGAARLERPTPSVPKEVAATLHHLYDAGDSTWPTRARQALSVLPSEWKPLVRLLRGNTEADHRSLSRSQRRGMRRALDGYLVGGKCRLRVVPRAGQTEPELEFCDPMPCRSGEQS